MNYTEIKVLDLGKAPREVWDAICLYAGDCYGLPNDSHVPWTVQDWDDSEDGDNTGLGYTTKEQEKAINDWALSQGIPKGEDFLFWMMW